jgi:hypothetical protein
MEEKHYTVFYCMLYSPATKLLRKLWYNWISNFTNIHADVDLRVVDPANSELVAYRTRNRHITISGLTMRSQSSENYVASELHLISLYYHNNS